jgi:outer membrane immunogenic protein
MKRFLLLAFASMALLPVSALAADMGAPVYKGAPPPLPPPPGYNWTGCFVGGGGYGMYNVDGQEIDSGFKFSGPVALSQTTTGGRGWLG